MKILILGRPRTRSTLLINTVSKFYNLSDKDENFKSVIGKFTPMNNTNLLNFKNLTKEFTQRLFLQDNFAIKLFPRMTILGVQKIHELKSYTNTIINELSYFYNIRKFDKIFLIDRNIIDSVYSYAYSSHIQVYNFRDINLLNNHLRNKKPILLDLDNPFLKFYIYESAVLNVWSQFLSNNQIEHVKLEYTQLPNYIANNYPNIDTPTLDNKFDYTHLISNYQECRTQILEFYEECKKLCENLSFS
jgi:hypothetical protein